MKEARKVTKGKNDAKRKKTNDFDAETEVGRENNFEAATRDLIPVEAIRAASLAGANSREVIF